METFNWNQYLLNYEDLRKAGIKSRQMAVKHFVLFGRAEGRTDKSNRKYNVLIKRLLPEQLNIKEPLPKLIASKLPLSVDLRSMFPPCYDQGQLGSSTANAIVGAYQYLKPSFMGSRLFLYYNERDIEHSVNVDAGAYVHDGITSLEKNGMCPESLWPYNISQFATKPPESCYTSALTHKVLKSYSVSSTLNAMKKLLSSGIPFIVGISVFSSFESIQAINSGLVPYPKSNEISIGSHCVLSVGFSDTVRCPNAPAGSFIFRNSWGSRSGEQGGYGINGYGFIPYGYLINPELSSDNWYITIS